jgi:hypothetical protein
MPKAKRRDYLVHHSRVVVMFALYGLIKRFELW